MVSLVFADDVLSNGTEIVNKVGSLFQIISFVNLKMSMYNAFDSHTHTHTHTHTHKIIIIEVALWIFSLYIFSSLLAS